MYRHSTRYEPLSSELGCYNHPLSQTYSTLWRYLIVSLALSVIGNIVSIGLYMLKTSSSILLPQTLYCAYRLCFDSLARD